MLQKLIDSAKEKLLQEKSGARKINSKEYRQFLRDLSEKKCPQCGKELELAKITINQKDNVEATKYEFTCGHGHNEVKISETVKTWEKLGMKIKNEDNKVTVKSSYRTEPGKNPLSVDGVEISWMADRKNNVWNHKIKDIKTGKILHHDEDMPLDQHNHNSVK
ncbi:MAG: hypothetical protein WC178_04145 [Candidatus Paceibacterota bacterium]